MEKFSNKSSERYSKGLNYVFTYKSSCDVLNRSFLGCLNSVMDFRNVFPALWTIFLVAAFGVRYI